jgi:hypothetical protein
VLVALQSQYIHQRKVGLVFMKLVVTQDTPLDFAEWPKEKLEELNHPLNAKLLSDL